MPAADPQIQALNLLNSTFVQQQAKLLTEGAGKSAPPDGAARITAMYRQSLGRDPSASELAAASEVARQFGPVAVARALFNCSEFLYLP